MIDSVNRTLCFTNHLTKFTVILNTTTQDGSQNINGNSENEIIYFYDAHWDKYLIIIIILVLLFLFSSALTCYHHIKMFKKPKNLDDLHMQH